MDLSTEDADLQGNPFEDQITEAFDTAQLRIAITFPGEVLETNGQVDGTTVTWEPVFGERNVLTAVASASGDDAIDTGGGGTGAAEASGEDSGSNTLVYLLIGLITIGAVVGLFMMLRRKAATASTTAVSEEDAPAGVSPPPESLSQTPVATPPPPPASNPPPPPPVQTSDGRPESSP
jgi:hypothetical protein